MIVSVPVCVVRTAQQALGFVVGPAVVVLGKHLAVSAVEETAD